MALERLKENETEANRTRKLNAIVDALNGIGIGDGIIDTDALPVATDTTPGIATSGTVKTSTLTLSELSVAMTDAGAAGCHGSHKLLTLPAGNIVFLGATCDLAITAGAGGISDTAAVVAGVGTVTVGTDNATLTLTEQNLVPSTAATLTDGVGSAKGKSVTAGIAVFDGTSTATEAWLNFAVPDSDSTGDDTLTVSGTVTLLWANAGDV